MSLNKKEKPTIGMLLDVEHFYGEHEGRVAPVVVTLLIALAPVLFYVYFGLFVIVPVWLFIIIELLFAVYIVLLILGRQNYRLRMFKRQLFDSYTAAADLVNIKVIHPDGCIEYTNGQVMYLVIGLNGTAEDVLSRSIDLRKFTSNLVGEYIFDMYIHNINTTPSLTAYYDKVHNLGHTEVASNFVDIIDHNKQQTENKSKVQCIIYAIRGRRGDWKEIKSQIDSTLLSESAKVFKEVYRVSESEEINTVINRDTDTNVFIQDLLRLKYRTGQYDTSRVIKYDTSMDEMLAVNETRNVSRQMSEKSAGATFHVSGKR